MLEELSVEVIIDKILERRNSCSYRDIYDACEKYCKKHSKVYIDKSSDAIDSYVYEDINKYWVDKQGIIHKQMIFRCPCCNTPHRKYPNILEYEKLINKFL